MIESTYAVDRCRMRVVVGGDSHVVEHYDMSGRLLDHFLIQLNLKILNQWNEDDDWEDVWSFAALRM